VAGSRPEWRAPDPYAVASAALSLDRLRDEYATLLLGLMLKDYENVLELDELRGLFSYDEWLVVGPAIDKESVERVNGECGDKGVALADSALARALSLGLERADIFVTDLDGIGESLQTVHELSKLAEVVSVHLHGDNLSWAWKPLRVLMSYGKKILPTSQVRDFWKVRRVGGFTDGDRAVILALLAGAKRVRLVGMNFRIPPLPNSTRGPGDVRSRYKLRIAEEVIESLSLQGVLVYDDEGRAAAKFKSE